MLCIGIDPKDEEKLNDLVKEFDGLELKELTDQVFIDKANKLKKNGFEWDISGYEF